MTYYTTKDLPNFWQEGNVEATTPHVGDEVAHLLWHNWHLTYIAEVDEQRRRVRALSYQSVAAYRHLGGESERTAFLSNQSGGAGPLAYWYTAAGEVLSERTWKPLARRSSDGVDPWKAGRIYPLPPIRERVGAERRYAYWKQLCEMVPRLVDRRTTDPTKAGYELELNVTALDVLIPELERLILSTIARFPDSRASNDWGLRPLLERQ